MQKSTSLRRFVGFFSLEIFVVYVCMYMCVYANVCVVFWPLSYQSGVGGFV